MKNIIIVVLLFFSLISFGCLTDYNTDTYFKIINHSGQKIGLVPAKPVINSRFKFDSIVLLPDSTFTMHYMETGGSPFPLHNLKSMSIWFNDTILIINYMDSLSKLPSGNILRIKDWSGGKIDENLYDHQFTFTEADYLKAIELQKP